MNARYYGSSGMRATKCPRITNLILQMDLKTWKQWNIWNAAAFIMLVDAGWFRRQYCQDRSIFSESARAREPAGVEGVKMDPVRNAADRRGSEHTAKHTFNATRSHLRVDARFLSHSDRVVRNPSYGANHTRSYTFRSRRNKDMFFSSLKYKFV